MHDTLTLVGALASLTRADLQRALEIRLNNTIGLKDWFDLADALLATPAIDAALARLSRTQLLELAHGSAACSVATLASLTSLACATEEGVLGAVFTRASERAALLSAETGGLDSSPLDLPSRKSNPPHENALHQRAIEITVKVDELRDLVNQTGLRSVVRGPFGGPGVSVGDLARLAATLTSPSESVMDAAELVELARLTGLLTVFDNHWHASDSLEWEESDSAERWILLAHGWKESLSPELRDVLATRHDWSSDPVSPTGLNSYLDWLYPLDSSWITAELEWQLHLADLLALRDDGQQSTLATMLLTDQYDALRSTIRGAQPAHIDSVIIQSDLTIIAPGPLRPDLETQLRNIARIESRQTASTYRLSSDLISHSMDQGLHASEIVAFLTSLSSTGVPQPVLYLINDIGSKHGSVRVSPLAQGEIALPGGSRITCSSDVLTAQIRADSSLRQLGLTPDGSDALATTSRFDTDVVMRLLTNAKYPAVLENEAGEIVPWRTRIIGRFAANGKRSIVEPKVSAGPFSALLDRLEGVNPSTDEAWMTRSIELAVRNKTPLVVVVAMTDGSEREFLIEPKSLSNGRLRGLDQRSEVERTIPVANVTALRSE